MQKFSRDQHMKKLIST